MPSKPKRKARGIEWELACHSGMHAFLLVHRYVKGNHLFVGKIWSEEAYRAGCPRLKPGEVKKVRVLIEEVK